MRSLALRLALIALVATAVAARAASWTPFTSKDGRFTASFPGPPQESTQTSSSPVGNVTSSTFQASAGGATFSVTYTDLPEIAVVFGGDDTIYDNARGDLLHDVVGKQTAFTDATVAGKSGKELDYTTAGPATGKAWMFLDDNRLYVLDALVPQGQEGSVQQFLGSFKLLQD